MKSQCPGRLRTVCARSGSFEHQIAFAPVSSKCRCALELRAGFVKAAEFSKKVAAHAREEVVCLERRFRGQRIDERKARRRSECHGDRHCAVQLHNRRWREVSQHLVERHDACPIRFLRSARSRVTCGDRGLQRVGAERPALFLSVIERRETTMDEELIPAPAS